METLNSNRRADARRPSRALAFLLCATTVCVSACATAPRDPSAALAGRGQEATAKFAADISDLSVRLIQGDAQDAFTTTWILCTANAALCAPQGPSSQLRASRTQLAATISARAIAVQALGEAYAAFKLEAEYDARTDLTGAVDDALSTANTYATLAGVGVISKVATEVIGHGAGLWADRVQTKRLATANLRLAEAVNLLAEGLAKEQSVFDSITDDIVDTETGAQTALLDAGLISGAQILQPVATSVGATLVKDPDAVLTKSAAAKSSTQAVAKSTAQGKVALLRARYAASLAVLREIEAQHIAASKGQPLDLKVLNRRLAELQALLTRMGV